MQHYDNEPVNEFISYISGEGG